jgi:hypothetical protein
MTKTIISYRYKLVHGAGVDFVDYQRNSGDGAWETVSTWMIPQRVC